MKSAAPVVENVRRATPQGTPQALSSAALRTIGSSALTTATSPGPWAAQMRALAAA